MSTLDNKSKFLVLITGQLTTAEFPTSDEFYFKYAYVYGSEWSQIAGLEEGLSSRCQRNSYSHHPISVALPIEATFTSTKPYGWPQVVISCYGTDTLGNDIIKGYGATHVPTMPGRSLIKIPLFVPEPSTHLQKFLGWITGKRPEFTDFRVVASSQGRLGMVTNGVGRRPTLKKNSI
ncbi:unnamed protein product [Enterobius vermicularis]|uniref:B9 domain-containing protein 1 n=1 Tax=Enterobius vermicularis TaxID=51028 RepID=A0A0N4UZD4_ENTVE|nr:unnamed protein product [Enterobius vermicularis]